MDLNIAGFGEEKSDMNYSGVKYYYNSTIYILDSNHLFSICSISFQIGS